MLELTQGGTHGWKSGIEAEIIFLEQNGRAGVQRYHIGVQASDCGMGEGTMNETAETADVARRWYPFQTKSRI